jgi:nitroreductase
LALKNTKLAPKTLKLFLFTSMEKITNCQFLLKTAVVSKFIPIGSKDLESRWSPNRKFSKRLKLPYEWVSENR